MPWIGLMEFGLVALFALGWAVLELYCLRLDRRKVAQEQAPRLSDGQQRD